MSELEAYLAQLEALPAGTLVPLHGLVSELRGRLPPLVGDDAGAAGAADAVVELAARAPTWRERLWLVPAETRLGVVALAEALGRPRSWVYRRTGPATEHAPLPCRKLDGELVFVAGEIRAWLAEHETTVNELPRRVLPIVSRARRTADTPTTAPDRRRVS